MVASFLSARGGCVVFMDYSTYSLGDYGVLVSYFSGISAVLSKKLQQVGAYNKMWCFGFSFGSRLCIDAGLTIKKVNNQSIDRLELCDPAGLSHRKWTIHKFLKNNFQGPGFDLNADPKPAGNNVACIDTSTDKGTNVYNCHQNFVMGSCGVSQIAAGAPPMGSHGLCPYFYISSFTNDFVPNNWNNCDPTKQIPNLNASVKMGPYGVFNR